MNNKVVNAAMYAAQISIVFGGSFLLMQIEEFRPHKINIAAIAVFVAFAWTWVTCKIADKADLLSRRDRK